MLLFILEYFISGLLCFEMGPTLSLGPVGHFVVIVACFLLLLDIFLQESSGPCCLSTFEKESLK